MRKILLMLLMLVLPGIACSQQPGGEMGQEEPPLAAQEEQAAPQEPELQIAEGSLSKVDAEGQFLWIKTADGEELQFSYNEETEMEGEGETVEGLANKSGSNLKVHYRTEGTDNIAVRIEVQEQAT